MIGFRLGGLLNAGVQEANIRYGLDDGLAFDGQYQAQHPVCAWMLRSHIDSHGIDALPIFPHLTIFNDVLCLYILSLHTPSFRIGYGLWLCPAYVFFVPGS